MFLLNWFPDDGDGQVATLLLQQLLRDGLGEGVRVGPLADHPLAFLVRYLTYGSNSS